ncbi:MAG: COX15/CtaA family protein, partial [Cyclobacteriaceae bacterium]
TFWIALSEIYRHRQPIALQPSLKNLNIIFLVVLAIQIVYGAFVAGLKAGYVYTTWPKMGEQWIADGVTAMQPLYLNFLEGLAGVQFLHRYLAYVLVILVGIIWYKARRLNLEKAQKTGDNLLVAMVMIQVLLGIFTLIWAVPISLGVIHQAGAFILLAFNLFLLHRVSYKTAEKPQLVTA